MSTPDTRPIEITPEIHAALFQEWAAHGSWTCSQCGDEAFWLDQCHVKHCATCEPVAAPKE
ncbi:MAG: hypothetical protein ACYC3X_25465 [Pirellulaceae bacterium]